jgi:hypothetical protein|tara:strand:- start:465 stop:773 length:309 start_codon:yes stop_codon:yes gene_type:complete
MENTYPPSGTLFMTRKKRSERSPDYTGQFEISHDVVEDLAKQMKDGVTKPIFSIVGWKKYSEKTGTSFLSLRGNVYEPPIKKDDDLPKEVAKSLDELDEIKF